MAGGQLVARGERTCGVCGVPLELHVRCWLCRTPTGPGHARSTPGPPTYGLCESCWSGVSGIVRSLAAGRLSADVGEQDDELVPLARAARLLGQSPKTLRDKINRGAIAGELLAGRTSDDPRGNRWALRSSTIAAATSPPRLVARDD